MRKTYHITTFGCQMNARDSEKLSGILEGMGYIQSDDENSDIVIINTCTVRENANEKVYGHLGILKNYKKKNPDMFIAICGCMMQEKDEVEKICSSYPFVNLIFGTYNIWKFPKLLAEAEGSRKTYVDVAEIASDQADSMPVKRVYPFKSGVNIMYGCDNFCTYCIVPYVRGRERSRRPEDIVAEIKQLVSTGVIEVMLLGQNVDSYGKGLEQPASFAQLLEMVCGIEGLERVRFMTPHPKDFSDDVIEVIKNNPKICRHLHMPLQSGSTAVLKRMNRKYTKEQYLALIDKIRRELPDASITTDIIVGFPGETEADFLDTMDVVEKAEFDSAFTFIYSKRTGTPAAKFEDQIDPDVVKDRFNRLLRLVQRISAERTALLVGQVQPVLAETINDHTDGYLTGKLANNSTVHFPGTPDMIGHILNVSLDEARGFYYIGKPL